MAERYQLRALLGRLNAGNTRHCQNIPFWRLAADDGVQRRGLHAHAGGGNGLAHGDRFFADIDNVRPTGIVKMRQAI